MATYVILSKLCNGSMKEPGDLRNLATDVAHTIKTQCPKVRWLSSYALMGRFDVVDIVQAESEAEVEKAALIIRTHGNATTETMPATPWKDFVAGL